MVEFHSLWQLLPAIPIAKALAPFDTFWHEDPIKMDSLGEPQALRGSFARADLRLRDAWHPLGVPRSPGDRRRGRRHARSSPGAADLSEARKIAAMAEAWHLPVAPHDCTGPVVLCASTHLSLNAPNALVQESVRAYYRTWYRDLVTALPEMENGYDHGAAGAGTRARARPRPRQTVHCNASEAP